MRRFVLRLRAFLRSGRAEQELARELEAHLRLLEDQFVAQGQRREEAQFAARRAFAGQFEQVKARHRDARSFRWLDESWLDAKLALRMLLRYPGLTVIAVLALAVAIGGGTAYLEFVNDAIRPRLPGPDGDRIVGVQQWNVAAGAAEPATARAFQQWRDALTSVEDLGAYRAFERNLLTDDGHAEPVHGVEISAAAFQVVPVAPLLGRPLLAVDEQPGAPAVAVLGERVWRARFGSDPSIVGRDIRLGAATRTVVGVVPERYGFPINHTLWVPLTESDLQADADRPLRIFGRLAVGSTHAAAQAELSAVASRERGTSSDESSRVRGDVRPYVESLWASQTDGRLQMRILNSVNLLFVALLAVCGANVATLVFGRTVTRQGEITVRTALGASRARIVAQLFIEGLVLASVAAAIGLAAASFALGWGRENLLNGAAGGAAAPFWWDDRLSLETWVYTGVLTILAAAMIGIVPALKATGREMTSRLKYAAAGEGMRFGGVWTGVVITQVSLTVLFLLSVVSLGWDFFASGYRGGTVAFAREQVVSARLDLDADTTGGAGAGATEAGRDSLSRRVRADFEQRLRGTAGVGDVAYGSALPGMKHGEFFVEFQDVTPMQPADGPLWVQTAAVSANYFAMFAAPVVAGRTFTPADVELQRPVAIVDEAFVLHVLGGRSPVGLRVRQPQNSENPTAGPWLEIVGVVKDVSAMNRKTYEDAVLYTAGPSPGAPAHVAVHVTRDAAALTDNLRALAAATNPGLRLYDVMTLDRVNESDRVAAAFFIRVFVVVSAVALLLSTAGVYSLMAFTVARRRREIGIRAAVGADRRQILSAIFARAFSQVGIGVAAGCIPGALLVAAGAPEVARGSGPLVAAAALSGVVLFMITVTCLACLVPARRALRVHPMDALRAE